MDRQGEFEHHQKVHHIVTVGVTDELRILLENLIEAAGEQGQLSELTRRVNQQSKLNKGRFKALEKAIRGAA